MSYDPENSLAEFRHARDFGHSSFADMARIMERAARRAADELWPDPKTREVAGMGAVVAAATLAKFAEPGRDAPILNAVGMFGLALVENARAEQR
jgi:hypothetical protein